MINKASVLYDMTPCCLVDMLHFGRELFLFVLGRRLKSVHNSEVCHPRCV